METVSGRWLIRVGRSRRAGIRNPSRTGYYDRVRGRTAHVRGFVCRPAQVMDRDRGRRPKAPEEGTRGTAVSGWSPMGIWRAGGFGDGWFSQDRREMQAADDCGLAAAAALGGVIADQCEMPCRRLQVLGSNRRGAGNEMIRRREAATSGQG